jgi:hypothetical protein
MPETPDQDKVRELLKQLQQAGATIVPAANDEEKVSELKSKVVSSTVEAMTAGPGPFGAWVSWTKHF